MLQGWSSCLVDECDCIGPILFEGGVDRFSDWRGLVLAGDLIFVFFRVHSTLFDVTQADVNDAAIIHRLVCCAHVGCNDEEECCEGLEAVGGMPVGGHSLSILFTIFGRCFAILPDEPVEHV